MDEGYCWPVVPGISFDRLEHGEEFSLFRMRLTPAQRRLGEPPALWHRNADMRIEGSNGP
jgi:hypothetical protein